jgi:alpha-glucoside transport system substrate-binding protein
MSPRTSIPRLLFITALVAACALVLAACGDDDDTDKTSTAGTGGQTATSGTPSGGGTTPSAGGGAGSGAGQSVSVLGIWGDEELASFQEMVKPWGGNMDFTGTRDITALLTTRVEGGNPPDVAIPAEVGLFEQFAKEGKLTPLSECPGLEDEIKANYPKSFVDLGTVDGKLYGFFMKADSKATIFYDPKFFDEKSYTPINGDSSFDDLMALQDKIKDGGTPPWSNGQEAGAGSGFPGSDTIQQIVLNQEGEDFYDDVVDGTAKFTDPKMKDAWQKFGQMIADGNTVQGGAAGINATAFMDATYPPFQSPPTAAMVNIGGFGAGFIADQFPNLQPGTDYDFMTWPGGKVTGGANIAYAFNANPGTCSYLSYIAGADAQRIWVQRGGFTSVNKQVDVGSYPDPVARRLADQLINADVFRFDLDDAIGGALQQAEFQGVTQFISDPSQLDSILENIESSRGKPAAAQ